jgi:iron complex outermembrane receptor protein
MPLRALALMAVCSWATSARAQADANGATDAGIPDATVALTSDAALSAALTTHSESEYGAVATATRLARPLRHVSAAVTVIPRAEVDLNPTLATDSLLRSVPSVATFRRSTSLTADPSSQGLNLRGVGPSGVSRSLVLLDGVPVNDPFAGSVYFRGLPRLGLARAEIVPGGGSALYGSSALSGVVQLMSRSSQERALEADLSYGSLQTWFAAARAAGGVERASAAIEGEWLRSDGYKVVAKNQRGPIDQNAESEHGTVNGKLEVYPSKKLRLAAYGSFFREALRHSTRFTNAAVQLATTALRARYDARSRGALDILVFGRLARFEQERARVAPERISEERAARQYVPAGDAGGSITWSNRVAPRRAKGESELGHHLLVGSDVRYAAGTSHERVYPPQPSPDSLRMRSAGGHQLLLGAFVEDLFRVRSYLQLEAALRLDLVRNAQGESVRTLFSGAQERIAFPSDNRFAINPRVGILVEPHRTVRVRASAYRSFRAATLNELYRPFQVGTVLTAANADLRPETLIGGELGLEQRGWDPLTLRAVGFYNLLDDPIVNATLAAPLPDGSMRQRKNLGRARVAGVELSSDLRLFARLSLLLAYTFVDSRVTQEGAVGGLRGKRLAQDPRQRASALLFFDEPAWFSASLQVRYLGAQYEDDLNTLRMRRYATVDVLVARRLCWQVELYAAIENLLDQTYLVGRAGVDTVGQPFLARVGLRLRDFSARKK